MSPDGAIVSVLGGKEKGTVIRFPGAAKAEITVGKAPDNALVIDDPTVSRHHLVLRRGPGGIEVHDLGSTNGTFVGTTRVREATVGAGAIVRAGEVELLLGVETDDVVLPPSAQHHFGIAVGASLGMRRIFGVLERIAPTAATILLTGETGTGKDALARSIHARSTRETGPFEVVDCGAITPTLIESELFGHERGAFTGAVSARAGAFERAAGGTLFLDEIGELALDLQPKLLRVLEARQMRRVGGQKMLTADVRIVAATTRDLQAEVAAGRFREDLYFRLAVVSVHVPPLRSRGEDLEPLVDRLLAQLGATTNGPAALKILPATYAALRAHIWPGNVRELRNVVERAFHVAQATGSTSLKLVDFPPPPRTATTADRATTFDDSLSYRETRARFEADFEREYVRWLLDKYDRNVSAAARAVKMDRNHLSDLARRHDLETKR
jgi:DNA-binding NtrC family response regulator